MISWSKFKDATIKNGKRILKVMGLTLATADECMPFGDDSCPVPNMLAVYAKTSNIGDPVIIGYINKNQVAAQGEKRIYSLNPDGTLSAWIWLKGNNVMEMNGDADNMVRYAPLSDGISAKDDLINAELVKVEAAIASLGGSYVRGDVTTDISAAKIDELKCG